MAMFNLNANLPPLPGQVQPMMQSPLAQQMAMGGQFQGVQAPGLDMGSGPSAGDMLGSLRAAMAAAAPSQGVASTSATPPAASAAPVAPAAAPAAKPPTWQDMLAHFAQQAQALGGPQGLPGSVQGAGQAVTNPIMALLARFAPHATAPNGVLGQ